MPSSKSSNKVIGLTLGDPAGIGPEVLAKSMTEISRTGRSFLAVGDWEIFCRHLKKLPANVQFFDLKNPEINKIHYGGSRKESARAALSYLRQAVQLLKSKTIHGLVTAPVCKEGIVSLGVDFPGHTEYLANAFGIQKIGMMFVGENLKTVLTTRHIPIKDVAKHLTAGLILETVTLTHTALKELFHKKNPHIGVCGLNPHAGENGTIGTEEITAIIPAIRKAKSKGINVSGPYPADTLFYPEHSAVFDAVVSMYHDQGLIAIKAFEFHSVVNLTLGLPFVRTSPAHGTAFDIAGKNKADPTSMIAAVRLACRLTA